MTSSKLLDNLKYEWLFIGNVLGLDEIIKGFFQDNYFNEFVCFIA